MRIAQLIVWGLLAGCVVLAGVLLIVGMVYTSGVDASGYVR